MDDETMRRMLNDVVEDTQAQLAQYRLTFRYIGIAAAEYHRTLKSEGMADKQALPLTASLTAALLAASRGPK